jgi:hypothetical protein
MSTADSDVTTATAVMSTAGSDDACRFSSTALRYPLDIHWNAVGRAEVGRTRAEAQFL